jgi:hypothetical protein
MTHFTRDFQGVYTTARLSAKQSLTPEGFLLCKDVPIARIGDMIYAAGEVPVEPRPDALIVISRTPEEVFRTETMASFEGKPVTLGHPDEFVGPESWNALSVGTVTNVRRGTGIEDDYLFADLLVTSKAAIDEVQNGLREVSCGYEADYEQLEPGRGVQRNIVGNHVALVERGRCGPRCAIGDEDMTKKRNKWGDMLRRAFKAKDASELEAIEKEAEAMDEESEEDKDKDKGKIGDAATADALVALNNTLKGFESRLAKLETRDAKAKDDDKDGDGDDVKKQDTDDDGDLTEAEEADKLDQAGVDLYTGDAAASIPSRAEILAPGIKLPTMDAKASTKDRALALCKCQRRALDTAYKTDEGKKAIDSILGSKTHDFSKLPAVTVHSTFMAASELVKAANNAGARAQVSTRDFGRRPPTPAELNDINRKHWAARS